MDQNKVKIAVFMYSMAGGGAERVVSYLLPYLKNKGLEVFLILMNNTIDYDLPHDLQIHYLEKSKGNEHGFIKFIKLPFLAYKYGRLLKRLNITHSLSMLSRPCYVNIMARWFTSHEFKMIISERNYPSLQYGYNDLQSRINRFLVRRLYPKADLIISNAKASADDLVNNFNVNPIKTRVIYNPMDVEKINAIKPIADFFDPEYFNLINVGRLQPAKNQKLLIEAISPIEQIRLYILGNGELRTELESFIKEKNLEDRVFLLGFQKNPYKYLKSADLFLLGSNHEGFPNVVLEAMCCGLPILSTNCKSGPEEIVQLKEPKENDIMVTQYGILSPVNNAAAMRKGLIYFLEHPDYLKACRTHVLKRAQDFEMKHILATYKEQILA